MYDVRLLGRRLGLMDHPLWRHRGVTCRLSWGIRRRIDLLLLKMLGGHPRNLHMLALDLAFSHDPLVRGCLSYDRRRRRSGR